MHAVSADGDGDVRVVVDEERHVVRGERLEELPAAFGIKALLPVGSPELHGRDACRGSGWNVRWGPTCRISGRLTATTSK